MAEKGKPQLRPGDLQEQEYQSTVYVAKIEPDVTPEHLLDPDFWAHHAMHLRPWDEVKARAKDGTWCATYLVLDCSRTWAKMYMLEKHNLTTSDVSQTQAAAQGPAEQPYRVIYRGPRGWSVVRTVDNVVLEEDIKVKGDAEKRMAEIAKGTVPA